MIHGAAWVNAVEYQMMGSSIHFLPTEERFIGEEMAETIEREKINIILMVGDAVAKPMLEALEKGDYDTSSVWLILQMGAIMTAPVKRRIVKAIPSTFIGDLYSGTEMWASALQTYTASDTEEEIEKMSFKLTPDIRVVNEPKDGTLVDVKPGEVGEVITHSDLRFDANYYKEAEKSKKTFRTIDGKQWIFTGDMGSITEDGDSFYLLGRGSQCINTGGEKVYIEEVEEQVETNPKVKKAAIVGVPDERWGEAVTALIQLKEGKEAREDEVKDFCRDKIAGYKIPKHVIFVDEVPVGVTGKCEYKKAKEIALKELGL
jgi:fatty-acyl-CoA synthase